MSEEDKSGPALVSSRWPREIIEQYKIWHRKTHPEYYEEGIIVRLKTRGMMPVRMWLRDDERISLSDYRRLYPRDRQRLKPHQLPEDLSSRKK